MIKVQCGDKLVVSSDERFQNCGNESTIYVDYKKIADTCSIEDVIYIGDEATPLKVTSKDSGNLVTGERYM